MPFFLFLVTSVHVLKVAAVCVTVPAEEPDVANRRQTGRTFYCSKRRPAEVCRTEAINCCTLSGDLHFLTCTVYMSQMGSEQEKHFF